jgi:hypothetical protein
MAILLRANGYTQFVFYNNVQNEADRHRLITSSHHVNICHFHFTSLHATSTSLHFILPVRRFDSQSIRTSAKQNQLGLIAQPSLRTRETHFLNNLSIGSHSTTLFGSFLGPFKSQ